LKKEENAPSLDENLFGTIRGAGGGSETNVGCKLVEVMARGDSHATKGRGGMGSIGGGVDGIQIHSNVVCVVGRGMDGVRVTKIWRSTDSGVRGTKRTLEVWAAGALAVS